MSIHLHRSWLGCDSSQRVLEIVRWGSRGRYRGWTTGPIPTLPTEKPRLPSTEARVHPWAPDGQTFPGHQILHSTLSYSRIPSSSISASHLLVSRLSTTLNPPHTDPIISRQGRSGIFFSSRELAQNRTSSFATWPRKMAIPIRSLLSPAYQAYKQRRREGLCE